MILGDHESQRMANLFATKVQRAIEREKLAKKYHKVDKKAHHFSDLSSSAPASLRGDMKWRKKIRLSSWSGLRRWNNGSLERPATISWSHNLVLENKHVRRNPLELRRSNLYRTKGLVERLNSQDTSDLSGILKTTRPSFYTLGEFMEPVHHRLSSDEGTEYEEMEAELPYERDRTHPVFGSARHLKNLRKVSTSLKCLMIVRLGWEKIA